MDKPIFFKQEAEVKSLLSKYKHLKYVDVFSNQIKELFIINNLGSVIKDEIKNRKFQQFVKKIKDKHIYVYFPWNYTIVKTITKRYYFALKTNRNQDLITKGEQIKLRNSHIAIFGMSVGSNIAILLAQAGIAEKLSISDFDELDHTNLNRILSGIHKVGIAKTKIVEEKLYENDPFLNVYTYKDGLNEGNISKILNKKNPINLIFDEIDNLKIKILIREYALKLKIPVIMITDNGNGVVIHVERYDKGYKKAFGKNFTYWRNILSKPPNNKEEAIKIIEDNLIPKELYDLRMKASLKKVINGKLHTWPQLGSSAILGASLGISIAKSLILKTDNNKSYTIGISIKPKITNSKLYIKKI